MGPEVATVTVLGSGSKLIGGAKSCEISRDEVHSMVMEGFFPLSEFDDLARQGDSAIVEFGLPYAADPAISKHIATFLNQHQTVCREALAIEEESLAAVPDSVLFNGGVFKSTLVQQRVETVLAQWKKGEVYNLDNPEPDLSVAYGAVAYGMARRGAQLKIGGGSARSYFLKVDTTEGEETAICLLPKGAGGERGLSFGGAKIFFKARTGSSVSFDVFNIRRSLFGWRLG